MPRLIGRVQVVVSLGTISVPQRMCSSVLVLPAVPNRFFTSIDAASRSQSGPSLWSARQGSSTGAGMRNVCSGREVGVSGHPAELGGRLVGRRRP